MTKMFGSSYTTEYVLHKCFPSIPNVSERVTCEISPLENARSFWSLIARMQLRWKSEEDRATQPSSFFIKLPTVSDNARNTDDDSQKSLAETLCELTHAEETFYRTMKNVHIPGFPYPHYYYGEEVNEIPGRQGCLVLEDFSGRASSADYIPGFSIPQAEDLVDAIASWHAFVMRDRPDFCAAFECLDDISEEFQVQQYTESERLETLAPEWFAGKFAPIKKYFSLDHAYKAIRSYKEIGIPPILVHMDMNTTNVLWTKDAPKERPQIAAFIDFQQVHTGNICEDLARIFQLGLSLELRREHEERLLMRYHAKLEEVLGKRNCPVTLEQVRTAYDRVFPFVANFGLFAVSCYYDMYRDLEADVVEREKKQRELLWRAKGIVDDIHRIVGL